MAAAFAASLVPGAWLCPHEAARGRGIVFSADPEGGNRVGVCVPCAELFRDLMQGPADAQAIDRELRAAGYSQAFIRKFKRDLRAERAAPPARPRKHFR